MCNEMKVPCICECMVKAIEERNEKERHSKKQEKLESLFKSSLMGEKYKGYKFEDLQSDNKEYEFIMNRCIKYCNVAQDVLEQGIGIYLYGDSGNGKTTLTACMANILMQRFYTVVYTSFGEIAKQITATFKNDDTELDFITKLTNVDFLFIDDIGTEMVKKNDKDIWLQEKVFEIVNLRYNNNKPIIFTSNYSMRELIIDRGMAHKTVDRIAEVCEPMHLTSGSFRKQKAQERERLF